MNDDKKISRIVNSIKKDFDTRMEEVQEKVSKDFNEDIEILKQIKYKIKGCFGRDYISYVIYGEPCFHEAYNSSCNKKESECETLFEKIISRSVTISNLKHTIDIPLSMTDEIENAKMLWTVVRYDLLDLNIFWGMEFNKELTIHLPEEQRTAYEYFKYVANYYLNETQKYYELFLNYTVPSNNFHDDRFSQADRIEIYKNVMKNPISTLAAPEQYARVPLEGMPNPIGEVYRDESDKKEDFPKKILEKTKNFFKKF